MKRIVFGMFCVMLVFLMVACGEKAARYLVSTPDNITSPSTGANSNPPSQEPTPQDSTSEPAEKEETEMQSIQLTVGSKTFQATLEKNKAASSFAKMLQNAPIVLNMSDYSGFEKVASLGSRLPTSNNQLTTHAGDIVLYNENQIVVFYGSHSWSYTKLGKIDDLTGWEEALGSGDVTITFSVISD